MKLEARSLGLIGSLVLESECRRLFGRERAMVMCLKISRSFSVSLYIWQSIRGCSPVRW